MSLRHARAQQVIVFVNIVVVVEFLEVFKNRCRFKTVFRLWQPAPFGVKALRATPREERTRAITDAENQRILRGLGSKDSTTHLVTWCHDKPKLEADTDMEVSNTFELQTVHLFTYSIIGPDQYENNA